MQMRRETVFNEGLVSMVTCPSLNRNVMWNNFTGLCAVIKLRQTLFSEYMLSLKRSILKQLKTSLMLHWSVLSVSGLHFSNIIDLILPILLLTHKPCGQNSRIKKTPPCQAGIFQKKTCIQIYEQLSPEGNWTQQLFFIIVSLLLWIKCSQKTSLFLSSTSHKHGSTSAHPSLSASTATYSVI